MNNNTTTPAMKEVETVRQAAYRLVPVKNVSWDHNWNPTDANLKEREGFFKGAQCREENPVNPVAKEGKTAEEILETYIPRDRWGNDFGLGILLAVARDYAAQLTEVKGEEIPINCLHAECPNSHEKIDVIPADGTYIAAPSTHSSSEMVSKESVVEAIHFAMTKASAETLTTLDDLINQIRNI